MVLGWLRAVTVVTVLGLASAGAGQRLIAAPPEGGTERVGSLIRQLGSDNFQERERATQELVRIGTPALESLRRVLKDSDQELIIRAQQCITTIERDVKIVGLIEALKDPRPEKRIQAACQLAEFGRYAEKAVPALIEALDDKDAKVQERVANAISFLGPGAKLAVPKLIQVLQNAKADQEVRWRTAITLGHMGPSAKEAVPTLVQILRKEGFHLRNGAANALGGIGYTNKDVSQALLQALKDKDLSVRCAAAGALGKIVKEPSVVVPALIEILKNKDDVTQLNNPRFTALGALASFGPAAKPAIPLLTKIATDNNEDDIILMRAIQVFRAIGPEAKRDLEKLIGMPNINPFVRYHVTSVLQGFERTNPRPK